MIAANNDVFTVEETLDEADLPLDLAVEGTDGVRALDEFLRAATGYELVENYTQDGGVEYLVVRTRGTKSEPDLGGGE